MDNKREPKINVYCCEFNCLTVTVDVDDGVTPFMIKCKSRPRPDRPIAKKYLDSNGECIGTAQSSFYPRGPRPPHIKDPAFEWYKPESIDGLSKSEKEHVEKGGLLLRKRTEKEPKYHEDKA